ncbi:MAG: BolA family transcriptional regulator [Hyphomicrobiales bacterium]|nr:BolA family transcriptional regulator [Hyphomicrobiales bacterium]
MQIENRIRQKLLDAFSPITLEVRNESHKHAGHAGMKGLPATGETHFDIVIISDAFKDCSRVARHRMINSVLADELAGGVHALSIRAKTPDESAG